MDPDRRGMQGIQEHASVVQGNTKDTRSNLDVRVKYYPFLSSLVLLLLLAAAPCRVLAKEDKAGSVPSAYLLVIDHSGSMNAVGAQGKTRWQEMQERAADFIRTIPMGSRLWIAVFDSRASDVKEPDRPFRTEEDRSAAMDWIFQWPKPDGGTAYYDTLGLAFEHAQALRREDPRMYITIIAYTDGKFIRADGSIDDKEEHSIHYLNMTQLEHAFENIVQRDERVWICQVMPDPKTGRITPPITPVPIRLSPAELILENAKLKPVQTAALQFTYQRKGKDQPHIGKPLRFEITPKRGQKLKAEVAGDYRLVDGSMDVKIRVTNPQELKEDEEYSAVLKVFYPEVKGYLAVPEGGNQVSLTFRKTEKPPLRSIIPEDGATRAAGRPIRFSVVTLEDAKVIWDFGDTTKDTGHDLLHTYNRAGDYHVTVTASIMKQDSYGNRSELTDSRSFVIDIIDIGVDIDRSSIDRTLIAGHEYAFTCTGRGPIKEYKWMLDGLNKSAENVSGDPNRSRISHSFSRPGKHTLSVDVAAKGAVFGSKAVLIVEPYPEIRINEPQEGAELTFGQEVTFKAGVSGPVRAVDWSVSRIEDGKAQERLHAFRTVLMGEEKAAEMTFAGFQENANRMSVEVDAHAVLSEGLEDITAPSASIRINVRPPPRYIKIHKPDQAEALRQGGNVAFEAVVRGNRIREVEWSARDAATGEVIGGPERKPIKDELSAWSWRCPYGEEDREIGVTARTVLEGDYQGNAVADSVQWTFKFAPPCSIATSQGPPYGPNKKITFILSCNEPFESVFWDFGDGAVERNNPKPTHSYDRGRDFMVTAGVIHAGGKERKASVSIPVEVTKPVAKPKVLYKGKPISWMQAGGSVELADESSGDIAAKTWVIDAQTIPKGQKTLVIDETGKHQISLYIKSPPDRNDRVFEDSAEVEFSVIQFVWWLMPLLLVLWILGIFLDCRLFLRNHAMAWVISCGQSLDLQIISKKAGNYWSRWKKLAKIPLREMFPASAYWRANEESIVVRVLGKRTGIWEGNLSYTGEGHGDVTWSQVESTVQTKSYEVLEGRAVEDDPYRHAYFSLFMKDKTPVLDYFVFVVILAFLTLLAGIIFTQYCVKY